MLCWMLNCDNAHNFTCIVSVFGWGYKVVNALQGSDEKIHLPPNQKLHILHHAREEQDVNRKKGDNNTKILSVKVPIIRD